MSPWPTWKCAQANPSLGVLAITQAEILALAGRLEDARPIFARGLELEPEFRIRTILEAGFAPAITDEFVRAARLLGARE
jgi:adenylate cyclase